MTKRHAIFIQSLFRGVLSDASIEIPELRNEFERDYVRLCSALENHGLRFLTIDMIEFGKHLDQCLSNSHLTNFIGPHMRPYKAGGVIPRLFRGLFRRVFQDSGCLLATCDYRAVRLLRQLFYLAKKVKIECDVSRVRSTVRQFYQVEEQVFKSTLDWNSDEFDTSALETLKLQDVYRPVSSSQGTFSCIEELPVLPNGLLSHIQSVADLSTSLIGVFDPYQWSGKHGPGAVSDLVGKSKYDFPTWPTKLNNVFPLEDFAFANYSLWANDVVSSSMSQRFSEREAPSRLISVPKTQKGPRLIASEPICHQWCQQLVKSFLDARVRDTYLSKVIHFRDQTFNQRLARSASIDGSHWTIDLSDASDRVSCYVVERLFRRSPSLLRAFHACRTRVIRNTVDPKQPKLHQLRKFSTMGSALTFPVESLVFTYIVLGCLLYKRNSKVNMWNLVQLGKEVLVFGDDLIVPEDVGPLVLGALRYLGFKVNRSKTFGKGRFRESCGGEFFGGYDVTPIYSLTYPERRRPESLISCVATRNNFFRRGYSCTADIIKSTICKASSLRIPYAGIDSGLFCWETFGPVSYSHLVSRFCKHTHQRVVRAHQPSAVVPSLPDRVSSRLLQYFTEAPLPTSRWSGGVRGRPKLRLRLGWVPLL